GGVRHVIPAKANYLATSAFAAEAQRLIKGDEDHFLPHLIVHMDRADTCDIAVAFLLDSGARLIVEHLKDFLARGGRARILVGDYLDVTEPIALRRLADLQGNLSLRVYETHTKGFHLKSYTFLAGLEGVAFVGSSNLTASALTKSIEWNYKVVSSHDVRGFAEIRAGFEALFTDYAAVAASAAWIDQYERRRGTPGLHEAGVPYEVPLLPPEPHAIQQEALAALQATRNEGFTAGLVVLATGLGKTWLAAFDSDRPQFHRILFVAHREEILNQAVDVFRRVRPQARIGRLAGTQQETEADLVFASVQTLGRDNHLTRFRPDDFDYVVIDEFHHAAAATYRRVIDYFRPRFLLGLTATPERTDGADLLGLCQENLVFQADIQQGIDGGHLCPFHYFGVPDEIDYSNIPWRNVQFDLAELTVAVSTEARARNALEQLQKLGGSRCIAFCCSQRHADFMADFFVREGIRAVAVHSGPSSAPRATSLQRLQSGELQVIFAVDMFNEGVDVPAIDTVLMLRPTESTIIWLQQLGRGLRVSAGKEWLTVIDYIGNHRAFLMKLRGIAVMAGRDAESNGRIRELLNAVIDKSLTLPAGCEVTYDLSAVEILQALLRPRRPEEAIESFYRDFAERHGVRPTAVETFHAGLNPRSNSERSWLGFVARMGGLGEAENAAWSAARRFFADIEKTEATRSYKIVLLLAMLDGDALVARLPIEDIAQRVAALANRIHLLKEDFSVELDNAAALPQLLIRNPIDAFIKARDNGRVPYFAFDGREFSIAIEVIEPPAFAGLLREILDWRLAQYLSRGAAGSVADIICQVSRNTSGNPVLFLPATGAGGDLPEGPMEIEVAGSAMEAVVAKIAINVVRNPGDTANQLPTLLRSWFGDDAGLPGRGERVRLRQNGDRTIMEPIGTSTLAASGLKPWERYIREAIPPAFGLTFSQAIWNVGFVLSAPHVFLLVTLRKDDLSPDFAYADHFLSDREFSWQSQNRTTQTSKHGQAIRDHSAMGFHVHLLVRPSKRVGRVVTRFLYCGEVDFVSWEGSEPITVRWRLREPVPPSLWSTLKVPAAS
ncbi:MAG: DUF3427 domain-containing protein, partial [Betaproteobacteria bacterium]|nr:DUF3427 domain-containing protein [Betaproteobacteria bacterium]